MFYIKKWLIVLVVVGVLGFVGYKAGMNYIADKLMDEVQNQFVTPEQIAELKQDPEVKKIIEQNFTQDEVKKIYADVKLPITQSADQAVVAPSEPSSSIPEPEQSHEPKATQTTVGTSGRKVLSRDEAADLLLSKFSMGELKTLATKAKDGLTTSEKKEIKQKLLTELSEQEFQDIKVAVLVEMMKKDAK